MFELGQVAGSACGSPSQLRHARCRLTSDLGIVDMSARSGAERVNDDIADRQIGIGAEPFVVPGLIESETLLLPPENRR